MSDAQLYALKACALLLPTPFATVDPQGEEARKADIFGWLKGAGAEVDGVDWKHIEACAREAHDALVPLEELPEVKDVPALRHPLSAEPLPARAKRPDPAALHAHLIGELRRIEGAPDSRWYRRLWRTLMRHPSYSEIPADGRMPDHTVAAHRSLTAAIAGATRDGDRPALLALHVGPVQGFIKAARRTHDLSLGSYTVGFLAFAGARALAEELGPDVLVNPDVSNRPLADRLLFGETIERDEDRPKLLRAALMNRVLALVPDARAEDLARAAAKAIGDTWRAMSQATKARLELEAHEARGFDEQINAHLEIDVVAQRWPESNAALKQLFGDAGTKAPAWLDRRKDHPGAACGLIMDLTERVLAAHRKALPSVGSEGDHRPKCTICGVREQMGPTTDPWRQQVRSRTFFEDLSKRVQGDDDELRGSLQIVHGEGLCAVCLTKRFSPEVYYGARVGDLGLDWTNKEEDRPLLRFPSTASIASAPLRFHLNEVRQHPRINAWLDLLGRLHGPKLLRFTPPRNLLRGLGPIGDDARLLAHDGAWLYESTYEADVAWRNHFAHDPAEDEGRYEEIERLIPRAGDAFRDARGAIDGKSASPYYAVIVLDGDRMGDWKSGRHPLSPTIGDIAPGVSGDLANEKRPLHPALHGELSRRVALLGVDLHAIVDRHLGRLVYHGGDDLLAFLPLATALPCLDEIRRSFQAGEHLGKRVTISAGVAISHYREPLSRTLDAARRAEARAKNAGRNCFAIHADKRSGETLEIVLPWTAGTAELAVIPTLIAMLDRGGEDEPALAGAKAAYQLREELPALGYLELREAFLQRIDSLLFPGLGGGEPRALLRALLAEKDAGITREKTVTEVADMAMRNAAEMVDLLLFLRFLLREEHGILTAELLGKLPTKKEML